eukprot:CAMPEP_0184872118 /NCGR_PEP_ID=MMETSP0580-20130426/41103_1 /TAXON_ID=1118495 /ORGANISM="Dactyliosolen fragilissimus" /LENGTH=297 /DNA_ID=CAMNT_0027374863 /DNA_START=474 /DNA_END=1363 /DNA_ORIENTATION=+
MVDGDSLQHIAKLATIIVISDTDSPSAVPSLHTNSFTPLHSQQTGVKSYPSPSPISSDEQWYYPTSQKPSAFVSFMTTPFGIIIIFLSANVLLMVVAGLSHYITCRGDISISEDDDRSLAPEDMERRKIDIHSKLIQKKVIYKDDIESNYNNSNEIPQDTLEIKKQDLELISHSSESFHSSFKSIINLFPGRCHSQLTCTICLEDYADGDDICWSPNHKCSHSFHLSCMTEWLMKKNHCPICRSDYLEVSPPQLEDNHNHGLSNEASRNDENTNVSISSENQNYGHLKETLKNNDDT